jgi:hypothetical protein
VAALVLALICLAAHWNSFRAAFLLDNETIILKDPRLRSLDWQSVWNIFTHQYWWPARLSCDYSYNAVTLFGGTVSSGQDLQAWLALAALSG